MSRAKHWTITLNNPTDKCLGFQDDIMQFLICGYEIGAQGTPHIQGYVQFKDRKRLKQVKDIWPTAHLEVARGKPSANVTYCSKDADWHDHGTCLAGAGTRNDLDAVKELIDSNATWDEIRENHYGAAIRYRKSLINDLEHHRSHRSWETVVYIHWGDTGTGKSRFCHESFPQAYWKSRGEWWDGYDGHEVVIIDEFYGWLPFDFVLRLCDRYPMLVPIKGGFKKFVAKEIHFTSNKHWREWWPNVSNERVIGAFQRRIGDRCREYKKLRE